MRRIAASAAFNATAASSRDRHSVSRSVTLAWQFPIYWQMPNARRPIAKSPQPRSSSLAAGSELAKRLHRSQTQRCHATSPTSLSFRSLRTHPRQHADQRNGSLQYTV